MKSVKGYNFSVVVAVEEARRVGYILDREGLERKQSRLNDAEFRDYLSVCKDELNLQ